MSISSLVNNFLRPQPGQLTVIAGHPEVGKTSFIINWAHTLGRVAYFSYQHSLKELEYRLPPDVLIFGDPQMKIEDIKKHCLDIRGLEALFIDDLQHLPSPGRFRHRREEVQNLVWRLKNLAMELDVPVIVTSQLKQALRQDQRPLLNDSFEAKHIAIYADVIGLLYRNTSKVELSLVKNENGPLARVEMEWRDGCFLLNKLPFFDTSEC